MLENKLDIIVKIENLVADTGMSYIEAVIHYCEENNIEIEAIGNYISKQPNLKAQIEIEAENLNFLEKKPRLPI